MCFSLGAAATVVPKHQSPYLRSQTLKATETGPSCLPVTQRWPERDQKAGACSGKRQGPAQSAAGSSLGRAISSLIQNLPTTVVSMTIISLLPSMAGTGTGTPHTFQGKASGCLLPRPRTGLSEGRQKPGAVFVPEGSQLFEAVGCVCGCWAPPWLPIILGHRHRAPR